MSGTKTDYMSSTQGKGGEAFVKEITPQSEDFSRWYLDLSLIHI